MVDQRLNITRQAFSDPFVGYVLNVATEALNSLEVSAVQAKCLDELHHYASGVLQAEDDDQRIAIQSLLLGPASSSADIGVASMMRKECGGELPSIESDDEIERLLLACVRDAYPTLLMPIRNTVWPWPDIHLMPSLLKLKAAKLLQSAILIDDDLRLLFPKIQASEVNQSFLPFWQTGIGNEHQASEVPMLLVSYSLTMSAIYGELNQQACARFAREALMFARSLARGGHVDLPIVIGVSGIELADDLDSIDVACGELRRSTPPALAHFGWRAKEWDIKSLLVLKAKEDYRRRLMGDRTRTHPRRDRGQIWTTPPQDGAGIP